MAGSYAAYAFERINSARQDFIKLSKLFLSLSRTPKSFFPEKAFSFSK